MHEELPPLRSPILKRWHCLIIGFFAGMVVMLTIEDFRIQRWFQSAVDHGYAEFVIEDGNKTFKWNHQLVERVR